MKKLIFLNIIFILSGQLIFANSGSLKIPEIPRILRRFTLKNYPMNDWPGYMGSYSNDKEHWRSFTNWHKKHIIIVDEILERKVTANCQNIYERQFNLIPPLFPSFIEEFFRFRVDTGFVDWVDLPYEYDFYVVKWQRLREHFNSHCGDMGYPYWASK